MTKIMIDSKGNEFEVHDHVVSSFIHRGYTLKGAEPVKVEPAKSDSVDMTAIVEAIDILDEGDFSESTGKPHVESIEAVLEQDITAAQRDEAWKIYKKSKSS